MTMQNPCLGLLTVLACAAWAACADGAARDCTVDADCVSGHCLTNGQCAAPASDATGGDEAETTPEASDDTADATAELPDPPDASPGPDLLPGVCKPNHDGIITVAEAPFQAGHVANYRVTTAVSSFDTAPECGRDGCMWDLLEVDGTTADRESENESFAGKWYADEPAFAGATFASRMAELDLSIMFVEVCNQVQYGVYQLTDDALLLLGIVGEREDDGTLLVYDPPLELFRFPLQVGATWTTETTASGPLCNSWVDYQIDQTAETSVDAIGDVVTPYGTFEDALRVNTLLRRHAGLGVMPSSVRTQTFMAECFTSVAAIVSEEGEESAEFDHVAEVRRLADLEP